MIYHSDFELFDRMCRWFMAFHDATRGDLKYEELIADAYCIVSEIPCEHIERIEDEK